MFTEEEIVTLLEETSYTIELDIPNDGQLPELVDEPKITVAYANILCRDPRKQHDNDLYDMHGEELTQQFSVQFVCSRADLPTVWRKAYSALVGKNPQPLETTRGGLALVESFPRGFSNSVVWWHSTWAIPFPTLYTIV